MVLHVSNLQDLNRHQCNTFSIFSASILHVMTINIKSVLPSYMSFIFTHKNEIHSIWISIHCWWNNVIFRNWNKNIYYMAIIFNSIAFNSKEINPLFVQIKWNIFANNSWFSGYNWNHFDIWAINSQISVLISYSNLYFMIHVKQIIWNVG